MKKAPIVITLLLAAATAGGGYLYWMSTPLYALQDALVAVQNHDGPTFAKRVAVQSVVENLLDDVIVYPAMSTPGLSSFQQQVASGAVGMAKIQITTELLNAIYKSLNTPTSYGDRNADHPSSWLPPGKNLLTANQLITSKQALTLTRDQLINSQLHLLDSPAYAQSQQTQPQQASAGKGDVRDLLNVASHELGGEVNKLKSEAFMRMQKYVQNHPDTIPGRVMTAPPGMRGAVLRRILEDHGFSQNYFKGLTGYKIVPNPATAASEPASDNSSPLGEITITASGASNIPADAEVANVGLRFYNPKISQEVVLEIEMVKGLKQTGNQVANSDQDIEHQWCITRIANARPLLDSIAQDYLSDVHELIAYSLSGMSNQNMNNDMRGLTDRIKKHPAAQNFLKKLGI